MTSRWDTDRVQALAPDASSRQAAAKLTGIKSWTGAGAAGDVVWGLCAGSGQTPYQTIVDLSGPAFKCSCPSRKFPCKHGLALLLNWANDLVPELAEPSDFAAAWVSSRTSRATAAASKATTGTAAAPADPRAAGRRADQRRSRVTAGLAELDLWLRDQVRSGLSGSAAGYQHFEPIAARMVDAQAPTVATTLRGLARIPASGDGWPGRLLDAYAQLHLLTIAHEQLGSLPDDLAAVVRAQVGYQVTREEVLAGPAVTDRWLVLGVRDLADDSIPARRIWLRGERTGRPALLLFFDPRGWFGGNPDAVLVPGTALEADLRYYPGAPPLRAIIAARGSEPRPTTRPDRAPDPAPDQDPGPAAAIGVLLADWAAALAQDPWLAAWPAVLTGTPVLVDDQWLFADPANHAVPLITAGVEIWQLAAISGGVPVLLAGEWGPDGLRPLTAWHGDLAVRL